ncbi:MAG: 2-oxo acid dehydrogenase subunit E2, partial [Egibacteraceae bacterium]
MAERISSRHFGANAWVVEEMYQDYLSDPKTVSKSWREFFAGNEPAGDEPAPDPPVTDRAERVGQAEPDGDGQVPADATPLRGAQSAIAKNMTSSLSMPTATSIRVVPAKLLEVNRRIVNNQLSRTRGGKMSFTHLIGWAVVRGLERVPAMLSSYHESDGKAFARRPEHLNLGLAIDVERDGGRSLLVPNIKQADTLDFFGFYLAYQEVIRRVRERKLDPEMFAGTTATLTNPGTVGTVGSVPRLMPGQS